jgi:hypothetical protein
MSTEFHAAAAHWQLEKLYLDLAKAKGRALTPLEKQFLQGLLCGYSPAEITALVYQGRSSSAVRVYLSNGLYKYLQDLFFATTGNPEKIKNWSRVTQMLERLGYRQDAPSAREVIAPRVDSPPDWEEERDLEHFVGREREIEYLKKSILEEKKRCLCISGLCGVGKSFLITKLAQEIQEQFTRVIWQSLALPRTCTAFISEINSTLKGDYNSDYPAISTFLSCLRSQRYLIIIDQFEAVFSSYSLSGNYKQEYQDYQDLLLRLTQENQQSCCIFISREIPREIHNSLRNYVENFNLTGLHPLAISQILSRYQLIYSPEEGQKLTHLFDSNLLMLERATLIIKQKFQGRITDFLLERSLHHSLLREIWQEQLERLTEAEKMVLFSLALPSKQQLEPEISLHLPRALTSEAISSLERRNFIRREGRRLILTPLLELYLPSYFLRGFWEEHLC